jgi:hypothetical protein
MLLATITTAFHSATFHLSIDVPIVLSSAVPFRRLSFNYTLLCFCRAGLFFHNSSMSSQPLAPQTRLFGWMRL